MSDPNGLVEMGVNTSAHTIEMVMTARVIVGSDGKPVSIVLSGEQGVEMRWPGYAYPFIKNGATVLVVTTVVQVYKAEPTLAPKIIRPGNQ